MRTLESFKALFPGKHFHIFAFQFQFRIFSFKTQKDFWTNSLKDDKILKEI